MLQAISRYVKRDINRVAEIDAIGTTRLYLAVDQDVNFFGIVVNIDHIDEQGDFITGIAIADGHR